MPTVFALNRRQLKLRAPTRQQIQPHYPLFHAVVPIRQREPSSYHFIGENTSCSIRWWRLDSFGDDGEIPETHCILSLNSPRHGVEPNACLLMNIVRKQ